MWHNLRCTQRVLREQLHMPKPDSKEYLFDVLNPNLWFNHKINTRSFSKTSLKRFAWFTFPRPTFPEQGARLHFGETQGPPPLEPLFTPDLITRSTFVHRLEPWSIPSTTKDPPQDLPGTKRSQPLDGSHYVGAGQTPLIVRPRGNIFYLFLP